MSKHPARTTIRRWNLPGLVITLVAVATAAGHGYGVEAYRTADGEGVVAAIVIKGQGIAAHLARRAARAGTVEGALATLLSASPSASASSFAVRAVGGAQ